MDISFVTLKSEDWKIYQEIRLESLKADPQAFGSSYEKELHFNETQWKGRIDNPDVCIVVAVDNNQPIGIVGYHKEDKGINAHLWGMFVSEEYRGKGIGKRLLEEIIERIKKVAGIQKISLDVNPNQSSAVGLYELLGFEKTGERMYSMGDGLYHLLTIMSLKLT